MFQGMQLSSSKIKNCLIFLEMALILRNFLYFLKRKLFLYFRKRNFCYISGNGNLAKIIYISGNGTLLYFRKRKPYNSYYIIFQETKTPILGSNCPSTTSKKKPLLKSFLYFGKKNFLAPSLKNYFFRRTPQGFSSLFFQGFPFFNTNFYHCFLGFSCHQLRCLFVRCVVVPRVLRFEKAFFTLRHFLPYTPSPHLPQYHECYRFKRVFFYSHVFFNLNCLAKQKP